MESLIIVKIHRAKKLPSFDSNGFSDPYCKIKMNKQKFYTNTIYKNLEPNWNEEFNFEYNDISDLLEIQVWVKKSFFFF